LKSSFGLLEKHNLQTIFSEKYHPALSVRISSKNFGFAKGIKSVPLYAAHCITEEMGT